MLLVNMWHFCLKIREPQFFFNQSTFYYQIEKTSSKTILSNHYTLELSSWQRKEHETFPFKDLEYGYTATIGKNLTPWAYPITLNTSLGFGKIIGEITHVSKSIKNEYDLTGIVAKVALTYQYYLFTSSIEYENFNGLNNLSEITHHITWPFNFIYFSVGLLW